MAGGGGGCRGGGCNSSQGSVNDAGALCSDKALTSDAAAREANGCRTIWICACSACDRSAPIGMAVSPGAAFRCSSATRASAVAARATASASCCCCCASCGTQAVSSAGLLRPARRGAARRCLLRVRGGERRELLRVRVQLCLGLQARYGRTFSPPRFWRNHQCTLPRTGSTHRPDRVASAPERSLLHCEPKARRHSGAGRTLAASGRSLSSSAAKTCSCARCDTHGRALRERRGRSKRTRRSEAKRGEAAVALLGVACAASCALISSARVRASSSVSWRACVRYYSYTRHCARLYY